MGDLQSESWSSPLVTQVEKEIHTMASWCWDAEAPVRGLQRGLWVTAPEQSDRRHPLSQELA